MTVETCCFIRRRLIGLQTNSDGVVPQERKSFEWGWLERALGPQNGPLDAIAAWVQMLPTTRVALCRFVTPPKNSPPDYVCIATLVLERNQYAWLSTRLRTALADESFWNATDFAAGTALRLPNWKIDPPLTATQKKPLLPISNQRSTCILWCLDCPPYLIAINFHKSSGLLGCPWHSPMLW